MSFVIILTTEMHVSQPLDLIVEDAVFHNALERTFLKAFYQKVDAEHTTLCVFVLLSLCVNHQAKAMIDHSFANFV
tara:strand:+ start:411 stop:638 length:228 start_codon:yes stop_codon:yes gene_type:complete